MAGDLLARRPFRYCVATNGNTAFSFRSRLAYDCFYFCFGLSFGFDCRLSLGFSFYLRFRRSFSFDCNLSFLGSGLATGFCLYGGSTRRSFSRNSTFARCFFLFGRFSACGSLRFNSCSTRCDFSFRGGFFLNASELDALFLSGSFQLGTQFLLGRFQLFVIRSSAFFPPLRLERSNCFAQIALSFACQGFGARLGFGF
jgi:hypothetical protein